MKIKQIKKSEEQKTYIVIDTFYIPQHQMPALKLNRELARTHKGQSKYTTTWVVCTADCPLLPEGTICRLYLDSGEEVI